MEKNHYGSLCTEMYELLHQEAPRDELEFYLSYAKRGMSILEPLCGSGRFLVPFLERGLTIQGVDSSGDMLGKLLEKAPGAAVIQCGIRLRVPVYRYAGMQGDPVQTQGPPEQERNLCLCGGHGGKPLPGQGGI